MKTVSQTKDDTTDPDAAAQAAEFERCLTTLHHAGIGNTVAAIASVLMTCNAAIRHLRKRVAELEARATELEARKGMRYRGVFENGVPYHPGDACTWHGSIWIANADTIETPGPPHWKLAVKRGRDGRDGKDAT